jgi:hypothetical protein
LEKNEMMEVACPVVEREKNRKSKHTRGKKD